MCLDYFEDVNPIYVNTGGQKRFRSGVELPVNVSDFCPNLNALDSLTTEHTYPDTTDDGENVDSMDIKNTCWPYRILWKMAKKHVPFWVFLSIQATHKADFFVRVTQKKIKKYAISTDSASVSSG